MCSCGSALERIGEDVSEKLDYTPSVFHVERHIRGKWACGQCQNADSGAGARAGDRQGHAPRPAYWRRCCWRNTRITNHCIDRKRSSNARAWRSRAPPSRNGSAPAACSCSRWSTRSERAARRSVLHADETPVAMLVPGKGKTHRAYIWSYSSSAFDALHAVVYDFADSRAGAHPQAFLDGWSGKLVCDDYVGYKALFTNGRTEIGCLAHSRRKFHDLWVNHKSAVAEEALKFFAAVYEVEQAQALSARATAASRPAIAADHGQAARVARCGEAERPTAPAIAKAIDYSLKRWPALIRFSTTALCP